MAEEDFKKGFIHFCNSAVYFIFDIVSLDISSNCRHFNGSQLLRLINATSSFPYVFRLQYPRASTLYNSSNPKIGNICPIRKEKSSRIPFRFKIINKHLKVTRNLRENFSWTHDRGGEYFHEYVRLHRNITKYICIYCFL